MVCRSDTHKKSKHKEKGSGEVGTDEGSTHSLPWQYGPAKPVKHWQCETGGPALLLLLLLLLVVVAYFGWQVPCRKKHWLRLAVAGQGTP